MGVVIPSLSPLAPAHLANSIFLTEGICLLWTRTLWRTTFKMSLFTRVQTYSSSWCSQTQGESQLILVSKERGDLWGVTLVGYAKSPAMQPYERHLTYLCLSFLFCKMGLTGTSRVDEELTQVFWPRAWSTWDHGWWLFLLSWCFANCFTSPIPEPPCSLTSEALGSPGSRGTLKPFPQLWRGHLSVTFLSFVPQLSFTSIYIFFFSEHVLKGDFVEIVP